MDKQKAEHLIMKLTNAAFEAGLWHGDPNEGMEQYWKEKAVKIGDEIVCHLTQNPTE